MLKKLTIILSVIAALPFMNVSGNALLAQTSDASKEINKIKADDKYISAESTVKDWETAYDNAKALLTREIEDWLTEQGAQNIAGVIATANEHILEIKTTRGSLYRAFVYVEKSKLLPYADKGKLLVVDVEKKEEPTVTVSQPIVEETKVNPLPVYAPTSFEEEMLKIDKAKDIAPFIKSLKADGRVSRHGQYVDMPENGECYIFIYNREGNVPACLKNVDGIATNIRTGKQETISATYKGCGAMWFVLK